jgi:hypothetical protein
MKKIQWFAVALLLFAAPAWAADSKISALTLKTAPVAADSIAIVNSADATKTYRTTLGALPFALPVQIDYTSADPWTPSPAVGTAGAEIRYNCASVDHALAFGAPTGTPVNGQVLLITLISDASARALTWNSGAGGFQVVGTILPATTVASKITTVGCRWNATRSKWLVYAVSQEQ